MNFFIFKIVSYSVDYFYGLNFLLIFMLGASSQISSEISSKSLSYLNRYLSSSEKKRLLDGVDHEIKQLENMTLSQEFYDFNKSLEHEMITIANSSAV